MLRRPLRYTRKPGSRIYAPQRTSGADLPRQALIFPSNVAPGGQNNLPYAVIKHTSPEANGLPMWGPSGQGVTVVRRVKTSQQPGYHAQIWYTRGDAVFDGGNWGFHPYPVGGGTSTTTHNWEIASATADFQNTRGGSALAVVKDQWFSQALVCTRNSSSSRLCTAYLDLPSTANGNVLDTNDLGSLGESGLAATPQLVIGDSPWYPSFQNERFGGYLGQIKIIAKALSQADVLSEAANMDAMVTADGIANIWWGKKGFRGVDDLECDFGTGRAFTRDDSSNLIALGSLT